MLRWAHRRAWDARPSTLLRQLSAPLTLLFWMPLLRRFLDDQVQVTGLVIAWPDYLAELTRMLALIWLGELLGGAVKDAHRLEQDSVRLRWFWRWRWLWHWRRRIGARGHCGGETHQDQERDV
ncbi:hypothetical protein [Halochromatium roseum]|uniref:hypothetical protein n=1 Tax=Halochromatium roseum TaxID=391920 RepID=UPI00191215D8|nr:hypothetical protein [Halochromatium roseum]MBK5939964.1 hypothetical protein [Halochromatium roseum]